MRGRRDKVIQKWSRKFRDVLVLVFNMFPRLFPTKGVVDLIGKVENALHSKSKSAAVYQKETKLNQKGRSASAIMSRRHCIDHPQNVEIYVCGYSRSIDLSPETPLDLVLFNMQFG